MRRLFLLLILSVVLVACSSIECPIENTVAVNYSVMRYQNGEEVADTLNDTLWVWSRRADGDDTLLYNRGVNVRSFSLPASYQGPQDTLIFLTVDTLQNFDVDTVWISKEDIPHFESVDCAVRYFHKITDVRSTHEAIDTIIINNSSVTYDSSVKHLYIHFKK
jgi:hypothetical protein